MLVRYGTDTLNADSLAATGSVGRLRRAPSLRHLTLTPTTRSCRALHPDDLPLSAAPQDRRPDDLRPRPVALRHQARAPHRPSVPRLCPDGLRRRARRAQLRRRHDDEPGGEAQVARRGRRAGQGEGDRVRAGRDGHGEQGRVARAGAGGLDARRGGGRVHGRGRAERQWRLDDDSHVRRRATRLIPSRAGTAPELSRTRPRN